MTTRRTFISAGFVCALLVTIGCAQQQSSPARVDEHSLSSQVKHVLLIGLDGARADAVRDHAGPALRSLIDSGTACWNGQAELPSVTQVNWASILTGSTPAVHGIDHHPVTEADLATKRVNVPTLFDVIADHGGTTAGFLGHWKLYPNDTARPRTHVVHSPYEAKTVAPLAADYIVANRPTFAFVYLGDLDGLGHRHGWMSPEYLAGLADVDAAVQKLLDGLDRAGIRDDTLVILTADHGGHGKGHSGGTPDDRTVPIILSGLTVPTDRRTIAQPTSVTAIAPTILRALNVPIPQDWNGQPIDIRDAYLLERPSDRGVASEKALRP